MSDHRVLYLETGAQEGGSFESLHQLITAPTGNQITPYVAFLNDTEYRNKFEREDVPVFLLDDPLLSQNGTSWKQFVLSRIRNKIRKYIPSLYLPYSNWVHSRVVQNMVKIIQENNIDLLHLNTQIGRDLLGVEAARQSRIPCISHLRSTSSGKFPDACAQYANKYVTKFIPNSEQTARYWNTLGINREKMEVVHNAIQIREIHPVNLRNEWKIDPDKTFVICCVGRLIDWKKQDVLLKALGKLKNSREDFHALIVGDGPEFDRLNSLVDSLSLQENVTLTGYDSRGENIISACDVLVLPSKNEPFGRVLLEAMMVNTPIVATNSGGVPEIITHGKNGLLVPPNNPDALREEIVNIWDNPDLRKKLTNNGHNTLRKHFTIKRYQDHLNRIYRKATKNSTL